MQLDAVGRGWRQNLVETEIWREKNPSRQFAREKQTSARETSKFADRNRELPCSRVENARMSETGEELRENNEKIVKLIQELKAQRDEMNVLIVKQEEEKSHLETEIERITYKLTLVKQLLPNNAAFRINSFYFRFR